MSLISCLIHLEVFPLSDVTQTFFLLLFTEIILPDRNSRHFLLTVIAPNMQHWTCRFARGNWLSCCACHLTFLMIAGYLTSDTPVRLSDSWVIEGCFSTADTSPKPSSIRPEDERGGRGGSITICWVAQAYSSLSLVTQVAGKRGTVNNSKSIKPPWGGEIMNCHSYEKKNSPATWPDGQKTIDTDVKTETIF